MREREKNYVENAISRYGTRVMKKEEKKGERETKNEGKAFNPRPFPVTDLSHRIKNKGFY